MLEEVLNSKTKILILKLFAKGGKYQVSDVARMCKISKSRASECLREFAEKGILESRHIGRSVVYNLAPTYLAKTVSKIFAQDELFLHEIEKSFVSEAKKIKGILSIVLFGSALKGLEIGSDIDFLVVYEKSVKREKIYEITSRLTAKYGFHVSATLMSLKEIKQKAKKGEEFVINVLADGKPVYGKNLENLIWPEK
jgi:predicted nucleotidyltransferase